MRRKAAANLLVLCLAGACTGAPETQPTPTPPPVPRGGTLRVGSPLAAGGEFTNPLRQPTALDPNQSGFADSFELFRCCLVRTLLGYTGSPTRDGGATLQPDLAASLPEVSADGLTWTFRLKPGLRYGPPLADVEIRAQDFVRALEREGKVGFFAYLYSVIEGFDAYVAGEADSIAGMEVPDDRTVRVHLVKPTGDLGERFTLSVTAPIPPGPGDPSARLGTATGHEGGYGGFLVSSGPYMLEGVDAVDFTLPPAEQRPASGLRPGESITLVRNPSWDPATDSLRGAYVDRIEITFQQSKEDSARALDEGRIDLVFLGNERPPQAPLSQVAEYRGDPTKGIVSSEPADTLQFISMNLAFPPLDDVQVRKAINRVVDKAAIQESLGGPDVGQVIGHVTLNSLENDLLLDYDPYGAAGQGGDVAGARQEMSRSRYDRDHDGLCDASVCKGLRAVAHDDPIYGQAVAEQIQADLGQIGIELDVELSDLGGLFESWADPSTRTPLTLTLSWQKEMLNASTWFDGLFSSRSLEGTNHPLLGATPEQLAGWGYSVTEVPSVDDRIDVCLGLVGQSQLRCWVDLDQHLMENVVPWVPYVVFNMVNGVPNRIVRFSYDQFGNLPALDQIALAPTS